MNELMEVGGQWYQFDISTGNWIAISAVAAAVIAVTLAAKYRRVVKPNTVHIVQSRKETINYGRGYDAGNAYYEWPTWWPVIGVQKIVLPLSIFDLDLKNYDAYDEDKVPFMVDVKAFFIINLPSVAAERVSDMRELMEQLTGILQGTVRMVLAKYKVETIMIERSTFGELFTKETEDQLKEWGVRNAKPIELMDIRDGTGSETITRIMAKKESKIENESRQEVALNLKEARIAEIDATREGDVRDQQAQQLVGERTAEKDKAVGVAKEVAKQEVQAEAKVTADRDMDVVKVKVVREADIRREAQVVKADETRQTDIIKAEGTKQQTIIVAEGDLQDQLREAEGTLAIGEAVAEAQRLLEMARVSPELALAEEIGENAEYQEYLISIRDLEKEEEVGKANAKALEVADIKVIANGGNVSSGIEGIGDLFSSKGGTAVGASLEGLANTEVGKAVLERLGVNGAAN